MAVATKESEAFINEFDHPDHGWKWRACEVRWIEAMIREAVATEREACAKVCRQRAEKIAAEADRCAAEETDEVSAIRSTAWQLTMAENEILKRSNA